jgi:demethylmenaquinone methyltransferase/2-methoxy-6-polyprenyl-1,4-benzoquinol methylase
MSDKITKDTSFGFRQIDSREKSKMVGNVFDTVASNYDLMNDLMSFGIHRLWKRVAIESSSLRENSKVLDLAGGTGDMVKLMSGKVGEEGLMFCDHCHFCYKTGV